MTTSSIKVSDLFIRFFHWTMEVAFITSYLTEGETNLHFYSGWYILLLLSLRVI
jgi:cytochrome b